MELPCGLWVTNIKILVIKKSDGTGYNIGTLSKAISRHDLETALTRRTWPWNDVIDLEERLIPYELMKGW